MVPREGEGDLERHYGQGGEQARLQAGAGRLEFARTKEIILRHLPPGAEQVADIGGGPGAYSLWLASLGYKVAHRDIVGLHVEQLRACLGFASSISTAVADARDLDLPSQSVDAALLLGPLYHLQQRSERLQALAEAGRVLRPGGVAFVAAISRWSARVDGLLAARIYESWPQALGMIDQVEKTGVLPPLFPGSFTGYAHRPEQLRQEVEESGFACRALLAVEGPAVLFSDLEARLDDERGRSVLLDSLRATEAVPELLGATSHLLAVVERPR